MKPKLLRLLLLPAILCTLLAVGSFATAGTAHAASLQSHVSPSVSRVYCAEGVLQIYTDYDPSTGYTDLDCFSGYGSMPVVLYNVLYLYTEGYTLNWTWVDCNGNTHYSQKGPDTEVNASNADGNLGFAGYNVMCKITKITLS